MANRIFDTLSQWIDARRRRARRGDPRRPARAASTRAQRAQARRLFALGAGDAGRAQGADHPRLLHAAAAAVPVRGQCRGALPRAGGNRSRSQMLERHPPRRCCSKPRGSRTVAAGRALAAIIPAGERLRVPDRARTRRSASATQIAAWLEHAGGLDAAMAQLSAALGIEPDDTHRQRRSTRSSRARICRSSEWAAVGRRSARAGSRTTRGRARRLDRSSGRRRRDARRGLSLGVSHRRRTSRARPIITAALVKSEPELAQRLADEQSRVRALLRAAARRPGARPHRWRCSPSRIEVIGRYAAEKDHARPARLRRPDRAHAATARPRRIRLGALQARPRHRPRADRRGAGHEPAAMGHHQALRRRVHRRRRRARRAAALDLRGRRRQAVDLLVPGRGAGSVRRDAPASSSARTRDAGLPFQPIPFKYSFRSVPVGARCGGRGVQAAGRPRRADRRSGADRARGGARGRARPGRAVAAGRAGREARGRCLGRAVRHTSETSPRVKLARQIASAVKTWLERGDLVGDGDERHAGARRRHPDPGAPARRAVRGDHPRAEERRHPGRRRRPAGADRAHRGHGPAGAGRRAAAAGRRSRAGDGAEEPAVRAVARRSCSSSRTAATARWRAALRGAATRARGAARCARAKRRGA